MSSPLRSGTDAVPTAAAGDRRAEAGILVAGDHVDRYVIERELGRGGMGIVYAALDPVLQRKVALKIVRPDDNDPTAGLRMSREARAMAKLTHPNVLTVHDVGQLPGGQNFVAMELVEGGSLRANMRRDLGSMLDLLLQAARGLDAAHGAGLIHRDFKPDNVLVGRDGRLRLGDFGLVRGDDDAAMNATGALTKAGSVLGTPGYMAPEQHMGVAASAKADQYAFGITLYEVFAGKRPFLGSYEDIQQAKLLRDEPPPLPPGVFVPPPIAVVLARALARDPEQRFRSMAEIIALLEQAATQIRPPALPAPAVPLVSARPPPPNPTWQTPSGRAPGGSWEWWKYAVLIAACVVGLTMAALVLFFVIRSTSSAKSSSAHPPTPSEPAPKPRVVSGKQPELPAFTPLLKDPTLKSQLSCESGATTFRDAPSRTLACMRADRKLHGPFLRLHPNGRLAEQGVYIADKLDGRAFRFDDGGKLIGIDSRAQDRPDGSQLEVYPSGIVKREAAFFKGIRHGITREWDEEGTMRRWLLYNNGQLVDTGP